MSLYDNKNKTSALHYTNGGLQRSNPRNDTPYRLNGNLPASEVVFKNAEPSQKYSKIISKTLLYVAESILPGTNLLSLNTGNPSKIYIGEVNQQENNQFNIIDTSILDCENQFYLANIQGTSSTTCNIPTAGYPNLNSQNTILAKQGICGNEIDIHSIQVDLADIGIGNSFVEKKIKSEINTWYNGNVNVLSESTGVGTGNWVASNSKGDSKTIENTIGDRYTWQHGQIQYIKGLGYLNCPNPTLPIDTDYFDLLVLNEYDSFFNTCQENTCVLPDDLLDTTTEIGCVYYPPKDLSAEEICANDQAGIATSQNFYAAWPSVIVENLSGQGILQLKTWQYSIDTESVIYKDTLLQHEKRLENNYPWALAENNGRPANLFRFKGIKGKCLLIEDQGSGFITISPRSTDEFSGDPCCLCVSSSSSSI